jgi:succinyl-diaminopimelate desuccinylase
VWRTRAWLDAVAEGRTAHGSMPHLGDNAIHKLARALTRLDGFRFDAPAHDLLVEPTLNVGTISGGININSVPDRACAGLDLRTVPGLAANAVGEQLAAATGREVRLVPRLALDPIDTDPDDPWAGEVFEIMAPLCGEAPVPRGLAYFTDAAALVPAYGTPPTIICGPATPTKRTGQTSPARSRRSRQLPTASLRSHAAGAGSEARVQGLPSGRVGAL